MSLRTNLLTHRPRVAVVLLSLQLLAVGACALNAHGPISQVDLARDDLADFRRRVERYMELHSTLQENGVPLAQTSDVGQNQASQQVLASGIRAARHDARRGEIFTPAISATLRRALNPQLRGATAGGTRASIRDDAPAEFALRVNGAYPDGASLPTTPPNVLEILPPLPEGLEYRIVDTHLVLLDVDAGIVVDYVFDVMCARC